MKQVNRINPAAFFLSVILAGVPGIVWSYDFSLMSNDCELLVSYPKLAGDTLQHAKTDKTILICSKSGEGLSCITRLEGNDKAETKLYDIQMDSHPYLVFGTADGSEFIVVDISEIAASYTARVMDDDFMGAKVCSMTYWTREQQEALDQVINLMTPKK